MNHFRALCAALLLACFASSAHAAKCSVREYTNIGLTNGYQTQNAVEPGTDQPPIDFSGGVASSAAFAASTAFVRLICDTQAAFVFGASPTATTNNSFIAVGIPEYFNVPKGASFKVSVVSRP